MKVAEPVTLMESPIFTDPPIPAPPETINAPFVVVIEIVLDWIFTSPTEFIEPPIFILPPTPAPPETINAPFVIVVDFVVDPTATIPPAFM